MLKNYFTVALRSLISDKFYSFINILGLSIGIAALVWAFQNYRFCFSFDDFQTNREIVYRGLFQDDSPKLKGGFPAPLPNQAKEEFPEIADIVRLDGEPVIVKADHSEAFWERVHFTDPSFFDFFNFPLIEGTINLSEPSSILITKKMAKKYFGDSNPIGQTLYMYADEENNLPLKVQGILKNPPVNSTIKFDFITTFDNLYSGGQPVELDGFWQWYLDAAFFKIKNESTVRNLERAFDKYIPLQNEARPEWKIKSFALMKMTDYAKSTDIDFDFLYQRPIDAAAYGPLVIAILVFLSACMNFTNTTISRSNKRLKEMGVRKVLGGTKQQLRWQMLLEGAAIVFLAIIGSIIINSWWIPTFNAMFGNNFAATVDYFNDPELLSFLAAILIVATILASAYPAFYTSQFGPNTIFKGTVKFGGNNLFSRILLGLQIAISLVTIIAGVGFARNSIFQKNYDYGYERDNLLTIQIKGESEFNSLKNELQKYPAVEELAGTRSLMGFFVRRNKITVEGKDKNVQFLEVGPDFIEMMDMNILAGRPFNEDFGVDFGKSIIITKRLAERYDWQLEEALGKIIELNQNRYSVIGVLDDFHSAGTFFFPVEPAIMLMVKPDRYANLLVKARPGQLTDVFNLSKDIWNENYPMRPFNASYLDESSAAAMSQTFAITKIFSGFAVVTIILSITGLFALMSLTIIKRFKEIAVRRVVGASSSNIMYLVNRGYIWILVLALLLGALGGYFLTKLLLDLIFQVNSGVSFSLLLVSSILILGIALLTMGLKLWQTLRINPAEILNSE